MKYVYNVLNENSPTAFEEACERIEGFSSKIVKQNLLVDVDGTTIQVYLLDGKEIVLFDDYEVGAVFIESEIRLSGIGYIENIK